MSRALVWCRRNLSDKAKQRKDGKRPEPERVDRKMGDRLKEMGRERTWTGGEGWRERGGDTKEEYIPARS